MNQFIKKKVTNLLEGYPKVFFCHVPKCGGVSLSDAIYQSLYPKVFKASRFVGSIDLKGSKICSEILDIDMMLAREAQLINFLHYKNQVYVTGHCRARPEVTQQFHKNWNFITILREPNKRFVSEYIYNRFKQSSWVKSESEISAYLTSEKAKLSCTTYARFFSNFNDPEEILANKDEAASSAIENLKRFSSVGILEDLESWKTKFNKSFDTRITISSKNTTPNSEEANKIYNDPNIMECIDELNEVDQIIYDAVKKW